MAIAGNQNIISFLEKAMDNSRLAHSYIFCGPKNVGKTKVAEWLASKLLNTPAEKLRINPDFLHIEQESIGKEDIEMAVNWLTLSPFGNHKVLIINNAHEMSISAANGFLKTLEEPAKKAIIILVTSEPGKILPTIISRSAILNFKSASKDEIFQFLRNQYNVSDIKKFVNAACGKPGRAVDFIENPEKLNQSSANIQEFLQLFFGECQEKFGIVAKLTAAKGESTKEKLSQKIDFWMEVIRDILLLKYNLNDNLVYAKDRELLEKASRSRPPEYFSSLCGKLIKMKQLLSNNINFKLMLENLII